MQTLEDTLYLEVSSQCFRLLTVIVKIRTHIGRHGVLDHIPMIAQKYFFMRAYVIVINFTYEPFH